MSEEAGEGARRALLIGPMGGGAAPHDIHHYKVRRGCPDRRAAAERPPRRRPRARARERSAGSPVADASPAAPRR